MALKERLHHVLWIGGGSGAGKSTVARRIAAQYGLRVYSTDDAMRDCSQQSLPIFDVSVHGALCGVIG